MFVIRCIIGVAAITIGVLLYFVVRIWEYTDEDSVLYPPRKEAGRKAPVP